jgi:hypothetical protein
MEKREERRKRKGMESPAPTTTKERRRRRPHFALFYFSLLRSTLSALPLKASIRHSASRSRVHKERGGWEEEGKSLPELLFQIVPWLAMKGKETEEKELCRCVFSSKEE